MASDEPIDGRCGCKVSEASDGSGYCELTEGFGVEDKDSGPCKYHGGASTGAPKGNQNGQKHGLYSQRSLYYEDLPAEEKAWVDSLVQSMLEDAPFTEDNFQKFQMLRNVAIDMHKLRQANDYTSQKGLVQENIVRDEEGNPMMDENGELLTETDENPINLTYDRLNRTMTKQLKELGLLDDPESQKAQAGHSISEQLSELREELE